MKILSSEQLESKWVEHWRTRPKAKDIEAHYIQFWDSVGGRDLYFNAPLTLDEQLRADGIEVVVHEEWTSRGMGEFTTPSEPQDASNYDQTIFKHTLDPTLKYQTLRVGFDPKIVLCAKQRLGNGINVWVQSRRQQEFEEDPATTFAIFRDGESILPGYEHVRSIIIKNHDVRHVYIWNSKQTDDQELPY